VANRTVSLVRICKTEKGWRSYPVAFGKNGRIRPGWVLVGGEEEYYETGRYELRYFEGRKMVYEPGRRDPRGGRGRPRTQGTEAGRQGVGRGRRPGVSGRRQEAGEPRRDGARFHSGCRAAPVPFRRPTSTAR
jgi:hypothetical protein